MKVSTRCIRNLLLLAKESDRSNTIFNQMLPLSEQGIKSSNPRGGLGVVSKKPPNSPVSEPRPESPVPPASAANAPPPGATAQS